MFSFSLGGGVGPPARTCRGSTVTVAAARAVLPKKARRVVRDGFFSGTGFGGRHVGSSIGKGDVVGECH